MQTPALQQADSYLCKRRHQGQNTPKAAQNSNLSPIHPIEAQTNDGNSLDEVLNALKTRIMQAKRPSTPELSGKSLNLAQKATKIQFIEDCDVLFLANKRNCEEAEETNSTENMTTMHLIPSDTAESPVWGQSSDNDEPEVTKKRQLDDESGLFRVCSSVEDYVSEDSGETEPKSAVLDALKVKLVKLEVTLETVEMSLSKNQLKEYVQQRQSAKLDCNMASFRERLQSLTQFFSSN